MVEEDEEDNIFVSPDGESKVVTPNSRVELSYILHVMVCHALPISDVNSVVV